MSGGIADHLRPSLDDVRRLLDETRRLKDHHAQELLDAAKSLLGQYQAKRKEVLDKRRETASEYNLFRLLGLERYEVWLHSRFLADLLDPDGLHGQGGLFLRGFLRMLAEAEWASADDRPDFAGLAEKVEPIPAQGEWLVHREREYIDISVWSRRNDMLLFIENKIDAGEQDRQLARYRELLDGRRRDYPHRALIFLAPARYGTPTSGKPDIRLSYENHIACWLETCLEEVRAERSKANLIQYLEVARQLSGGRYELPG